MESNDRLAELFEEALARSPDLRVEFVRKTCEADSQLAHELLALLNHCHDAGKPDFLKPPLDHGSAAMLKDMLVESVSKAGLASEISEHRSIGPYELHEKLGEGGMGAVYRGIHGKLGKAFAVKILAHAACGQPDMIARFEREMKAVGKLEHPNIVAASHAGEQDGRHYLAMDLVDGVDVQKLIDARGPFEISDACELIRQAAEGIQHAHENDLVHRDIKPSNLMLTRDGKVKILDLGLAVLQQTNDDQTGITPSGHIMGTPSYMSPEQVTDAHRVDIRSDIYSLGATLYALLAGEPPFGDDQYDTPGKKMVARATQDAPSISTLRDGLPCELVLVLDRMMNRDPDERYVQPAEVAALLAPFAEGADLARIARETGGLRPDAVDHSLSSTWDYVKPAEDTSPNVAINSRSAKSEAEVVGRRSRSSTHWTVLFVTTLVLLCIAAGIIIRLPIGMGELVIEIPDDGPSELVVRVLEDGELVHVVSAIRGQKNRISVRRGTYQIDLAGFEFLEVKNETVTVRRFNEQQVRISFREELNAAYDKWTDLPVMLNDYKNWSVEPVVPNWPVQAIAINPDGRLFAYATGLGQIHVRRTSDFSFACSMQIHYNDVKAIAWRPDGQVLVSAQESGWVRWWTTGGRLLQSYRDYNQRAAGLAWNRTGTICAVVRSDTVDLRDADGLLLASVPVGAQVATRIAWSPDSSYLAVGHRDLVTIWDVRDPQDARQLKRFAVDNAWADLSWNRYGLVVRENGGSTFAIIDPNTGQYTRPAENVGSSWLVQWSPDGQMLATGGPDGIKLWTHLGKKISDVCSHSGVFCFDSTGTHILAANDREIARISLAHPQDTHSIPLQRQPRSMACSWNPNGSTVAAATDMGAVFVFTKDGTFTKKFAREVGLIRKLAWSPDGKWLAAAGNGEAVDLWDTAGDSELSLKGHGSDVFQFDWSPDGKLLASTGAKKHVRIWASSGESVVDLPIENTGVSLAWSADSRVLAIGLAGKGALRTWQFEGTPNAPQSQLVLDSPDTRLTPDFLTTLAFSPNGRYLIMGGNYGGLVARDWRSGEVIPIGGHADTMTAVSWSPTGKRLASASREGTVTLFESDETLKSIAEVDHDGLPSILAWSPDEQWLAVGGQTETVALYDANGIARQSLAGHLGKINCVAWHPHEMGRLAVATDGGALWQWDVTNQKLISIVQVRGNGSILRFSGKGHLQGANQEDLDYLREECRVRVTGFDGSVVYVPFAQFMGAQGQNSSAAESEKNFKKMARN